MSHPLAAAAKEGRSTEMKRILGCAAAVALASLAWSAGPVRASDEDACFYRGTVFSHGSTTCQAGKQYRCKNGEWDKQDKPCQDERVAVSRSCEFGGIT